MGTQTIIDVLAGVIIYKWYLLCCRRKKQGRKTRPGVSRPWLTPGCVTLVNLSLLLKLNVHSKNHIYNAHYTWITYIWKALGKEVKTCWSAQDPMRVREQCRGNSKGTLRRRITGCVWCLWTVSCWPGLLPFHNMEMAGREKELKYFRCTMKEFLTSNCSRILMYEGLSGYGKSQLLMEIEYLSQGEDHRWVSCNDHVSLVDPKNLNVLRSFICFNYGNYTTHNLSVMGAMHPRAK